MWSVGPALSKMLWTLAEHIEIGEGGLLKGVHVSVPLLGSLKVLPTKHM